MQQWFNIGMAAAVLVFGVAGGGFAQPSTVVIEGCLTRGAQPGFFTLTDDVTGRAVTVTGVAGLSRHVGNHRERLTGSYDDDGELFSVETAEHVDDACRPLYRRIGDQVTDLVQDLRRKAALGFRFGLALDPELMLVGVHAEFVSPVKNLILRPNLEFGVGQVTAEYAVNAEAVYLVPFTRRNDDGRLQVWTAYIGGGPSLTVFNHEFRERQFRQVEDREPFTLDEKDTEVGFNMLVGLARADGMFTELKAGAYGNPSVRVLVGYTF